MSPKGSRRKGMGAIQLLEESLAALRQAPAAVLGSYYFGSLPFVLGLLYFWTDMSKSPFAQKHLGETAFGMSLLYLWMKAWQAVFAARLLAYVSGESPPDFSFRRVLRMTAQQAAWQPFGLFAIPVASLLMLPFGWVFAYFHNLSVTGDGESSGFREASRKAWSMASLWSGQNHTVIVLSSLLWVVVFLNVASVLAFLPELLRMLTGVESAFTMSGASLYNTTFYAVVGSITYLCVNPMLKAVYVLRCFYGESLHSGADLKAELNLAARVAVLLIVFSVFSFAASGTESRPSVEVEAKASPQKLNEAIDRVISKREYQWRMPRKEQDLDEDRSAIVEFLQGIRDWALKLTKPLRDLWDRFRDWLRRLMEGNRKGEIPDSPALSEDQLTLLLVLLAAASVVLALFLWRVWRRKKETPQVTATAVTVVPDLQDENVVASQLPEEEWQALAAELMMKGELRLAMRALYMASLAFLAGRGLITIARYKSNRDYQRELIRRAREKNLLLEAFSENIALFERSWYGTHEVTEQLMETFDINHDRIRTFAQE